MAKKKKQGKNSQVKKTPGKVDFTKHLDEGLEDPQFPHSRGTTEGFFKDVGDEIGLLSSPSSQSESDFGLLVFCVLVAAAFLVCFMAFA